MRHITILLAGLLCANIAAADVLVMKDGTRVEGDIKKGQKGYIVRNGNDFSVVPFDIVQSLELYDIGPVPPDVAKQKLESLRHSLEFMDDLNRIMDRVQRFINANPNTPATEEAKQDLTVWQSRHDQGLVKIGSKWVTPEERTKIRQEAVAIAGQARQLLKQSKLAEADSVIQRALAEDPQNASALYLKGLLLYRQDQLPAARKTFEQVNVLVPNHGPTQNNIAVIFAQQNQALQSLTWYDQAMGSSPKDQAVLNNVAEALYALPDEQRGVAIAKRTARRFTEQDVDLQKELQSQGLHRWGATWVTTDQLKELKAAEREVQDQLNRLSDEFDGVKVRIGNIDREIEENERAMRRLEASSYVRDYNGNIYQSVLPPTYYQLQDDSRKLQQQRAEQFAQLDKLRVRAKQVNQNLPVPKYTGIQRVIDVEGTPVALPDSPAATSRPAA